MPCTSRGRGRFENGTALTEPRLVADGDVKGGRYVSGVYDLVAGQGAPAS
jgi:hypothetical protein